MELKEFKDQIEGAEGGKIFNYGISGPFSWRGDYADVAFRLIDEPTSREEILARIQEAYEGTFYGYKGGDYTFNDYTDVHFEESFRDWTAGGYCANKIAEIEGEEPYQSPEMRLVKLAFS